MMSEVFDIPIEELKNSFEQNEIENWDSLRHLNLVVELEDMFDISYEPEEIGEMNTFEKVLAITESKIKNK